MSDSKTVINVEEFIGKTVGKRVPPRDPMQTKHSSKARAIGFQKAFPSMLPLKGVYRFNSHEEANEWMWKQKIRTA